VNHVTRRCWRRVFQKKNDAAHLDGSCDRVTHVFLENRISPVYIYTHIYTDRYIDICIYVYIYMYIYVFMYVYMNTYVYVHIYVNIYVYIYICIFRCIYKTLDQENCLPYVRILTHTRIERDCNREDKIHIHTWLETAKVLQSLALCVLCPPFCSLFPCVCVYCIVLSSRKIVTGENLHALQHKENIHLSFFLSLSLSIYIYTTRARSSQNVYVYAYIHIYTHTCI